MRREEREATAPSYCEKTEISLSAAIVSVLSEPVGIFTLKEEHE